MDLIQNPALIQNENENENGNVKIRTLSHSLSRSVCVALSGIEQIRSGQLLKSMDLIHNPALIQNENENGNVKIFVLFLILFPALYV